MESESIVTRSFYQVDLLQDRSSVETNVAEVAWRKVRQFVRFSEAGLGQVADQDVLAMFLWHLRTIARKLSGIFVEPRLRGLCFQSIPNQVDLPIQMVVHLASRCYTM